LKNKQGYQRSYRGSEKGSQGGGNHNDSDESAQTKKTLEKRERAEILVVKEKGKKKCTVRTGGNEGERKAGGWGRVRPTVNPMKRIPSLGEAVQEKGEAGGWMRCLEVRKQ